VVQGHTERGPPRDSRGARARAALADLLSVRRRAHDRCARRGSRRVSENSGTPAGEPGYVSLRVLVRSPPSWAVAGRDVYVCENPNLVAIAADQWGPRCAPLVCTDGMPAAAQRHLLSQLTRAGARLHYHGDFDWPGLCIGNHLMRAHGALPWRF